MREAAVKVVGTWKSWAGPAGEGADIDPLRSSGQIWPITAQPLRWECGRGFVLRFTPRLLLWRRTVLPAHAPGQTCVEAQAR